MAKYFRVLSSAISKFRQLRWKVKIALAAVLVLVLSSGMVVVSEQPGFCNSCHVMNEYYDSWEESSHSEVNCIECHLQPGFVAHVKGKINGLAQAIDCMVGRVGTKPSATILDGSCLRSGCHSTDELRAKQIDFRGVKFNHANHLEKVVDGIRISCGTCHSHFEGNEHFDVNTDVCFTCHFLKSNKGGNRLVQTTCQSCHEVPQRIIERGLVNIDHAEFVSYKAACDDSCHKGQIETEANVSDSVCLNCHSFRKDQHADSVELHEMHTNSEKVECFACHGKVSHEPTMDAPLAATIDCKSCHSDTHNVQLQIYTVAEHEQQKESARILSPMFLTHVACRGCHIEQTAAGTGSIQSIGRVAKAVPAACDRCHEAGTGQRYVPFWQGRIKKLHGQVSDRLKKLTDQAGLEADESRADELKQKIAQAKALIDSVEADGSWGVHNLKYSEALLLEADKIISEEQ